MDEFLKNLKAQAEANPMLALAIAGATVSVLTRFIGAGVDARNAAAWSREVSRRAMKDNLKV